MPAEVDPFLLIEFSFQKRAESEPKVDGLLPNQIFLQNEKDPVLADRIASIPGKNHFGQQPVES